MFAINVPMFVLSGLKSSMFTVKKKQNYPQNLQQSTAYRWQERTKNEITVVADDDCFCYVMPLLNVTFFTLSVSGN